MSVDRGEHTETATRAGESVELAEDNFIEGWAAWIHPTDVDHRDATRLRELLTAFAAAVRAEEREQIAQRITKMPLTVGPLTPGSTLTHRPLAAVEVRERAARLARGLS